MLVEMMRTMDLCVEKIDLCWRKCNEITNGHEKQHNDRFFTRQISVMSG